MDTTAPKTAKKLAPSEKDRRTFDTLVRQAKLYDTIGDIARSEQQQELFVNFKRGVLSCSSPKRLTRCVVWQTFASRTRTTKSCPSFMCGVTSAGEL